MNEKEISLRNAISYCIENNDVNTATNRIMEFIRDEKEALTIPVVVSSCVDRKTLIEDLDDKRIIGTLVDKDGWYYCRKETAQHLLDKYEIKHK